MLRAVSSRCRSAAWGALSAGSEAGSAMQQQQLHAGAATAAVAVVASSMAGAGLAAGGMAGALGAVGGSVMGLHTSAAVASKGSNKKKKKKRTKDPDRDKMFYTRIGLPEHQRYYEPPTAAEPTTEGSSAWTPESRRTGVVMLKVGMTADWDTWGERHPLTVLMMENVVVTQVKDKDTHGFTALQVGGGDAKPKRVTKPMQGHFEKAGVEPRIRLAEFPVTDDAILEPGTPLNVQHFVPGQYIDVTSNSIGKGFQGPMKRWGFGGQGASHGNSKSHRSHGSIGSGQDPGRVWKGKKMAGRMGGKQVTVEGVQVYKIDVKRNLLYVKGSVPGHAGAYIRVRDCLRKPHKVAPPFPTYFESEEDAKLKAIWQAGDFDTAEQAKRKVEAGARYTREPPFELVMKPSPHDPFGIHDWEEPTID